MLANPPPPRPTAIRLGTLAGHRDAVYALAGRAGSDRVFSGSADGMVVAWDSAHPEADGELLAQVAGSVYALLELPARGLLLLGHNFQGVQALDLQTKTLAFATALPPVAIFEMVFSESRQRLYCALGDGTLAVLRGDDFRVEHLLRLSDKSLRCLALHEGRAELAVGASDWKTYVLDLDSLEVKATLTEATNSVFALAYSPDGQHLLAAGRDAHLRRYAATEGYPLLDSVVAHMYTINHLAFSADGRYLASCSLDKSIKLWDPTTLALLRVLDKTRAAGHGTSVNKLVWPGAQQRLVSCSDDRSLAVWQVVAAASS
ncbi:WD40 repeat domain-containing protein [Hymenobacter sp. H14-R3]|uniref:WD40 repeat domain-containing protein n=1 Tax=Hymenobacter sp. H14-R3 TaxID=3046308 RepID=UPI0024B9A2F0|nr:WD40 repeat domain-containing protein [Hymenobacter sp. H14-R3]MDJ0367845.1 WD40 repeat domain-containing protein [Hymenobacter sp. H14-R3]